MAASDDGLLDAGAADKPDGNMELLFEGQTCLLNVMGRHFLVKILEVGPDTLKLSFAGKDYPIERMRADIEFHDKDGFFYYTTDVIEGPMEVEGCVVVRKPEDLRRNLHRQCCRVSTDLMVQVKDKGHARTYNAELVDISTGGALIRSDAPFDFSTIVDLTVSLPGELTHVVEGQVVHVAEATSTAPSLYGIRFLDIQSEAHRSVTCYIWERLQELYSDE